MMSILGLKQKDSFEQYDVDIPKLVAMLPISCRFRVCAIGRDVDLVVLFQRDDQPLKYLLKTDRVLVKMSRIIVAVYANVRKIQPIVRRDHSDIPADSAQLFRNFGRDEPFAARVDPADPDEHGAIRHYRAAFSCDRVNDSCHANRRRVPIPFSDSRARSLLCRHRRET